MKKYIITYDLNKVGQNYDGLINAIKKYLYVHPMQSVWMIKTDLMAGVIYNDLVRYIDQNDFLFISEINLNLGGWLPSVSVNFLSI